MLLSLKALSKQKKNLFVGFTIRIIISSFSLCCNKFAKTKKKDHRRKDTVFDTGNKDKVKQKLKKEKSKKKAFLVFFCAQEKCGNFFSVLFAMKQ